eukprot:19716-Pelagococcus_subviridis.AAC.4
MSSSCRRARVGALGGSFRSSDFVAHAPRRDSRSPFPAHAIFPTRRFTTLTPLDMNASSNPLHVYTPPMSAHIPNVQSSTGFVSSLSTTRIGETSYENLIIGPSTCASSSSPYAAGASLNRFELNVVLVHRVRLRGRERLLRARDGEPTAHVLRDFAPHPTHVPRNVRRPSRDGLPERQVPQHVRHVHHVDVDVVPLAVRGDVEGAGDAVHADAALDDAAARANLMTGRVHAKIVRSSVSR